MQKVRDAMEARGGQLLDHRPHQQHGPPLQILSKAFAECSDLMRSVVPRPTDCKAASMMVEVASQVLPLLASSFTSHMLAPPIL